MKKTLFSTGRLYFSLWSTQDLYDATLLWGNQNVTQYITSTGSMTEDQISSRLAKEINNFNEYGVQYWKVYLGQTEEFIGCCGLRPYDINQGTYEIGVHLLPQYWHKGYAKEACEKIIDFASTNDYINKLFAGHNPNNAASAALLKSLGFTYSHDEYYEPTGLFHPSYFKNLTK